MKWFKYLDPRVQMVACYFLFLGFCVACATVVFAVKTLYPNGINP